MIKEFFGDDLQDAISRASKKLGIEKESISYSRIKGTFGSELTGEKIGILVKYEKKEVKDEISQEAAELMAEFDEIKKEKPGMVATFVLDKILSSMGNRVNISTEEKDEIVLLSVDFKGEKPDTRKGDIRELRGAVQYIINRVASEGKEKTKRFIVDFSGDMEDRKKKMKDIGHELSSFVKKQKQPVQVELMDSQDRRLLHLALENEGEVKTFSQGEGRFRVLCIEPGKKD